ncbi:MAG: hypothetical protein ACNA7G_15045 [Methylobacter sp.]
MKTKTIDKNAMSNAHHTKKVITPAIDCLNKINNQAVNFDAFALEKVETFTKWLDTFIFKADAVITQGNKLYENRNKPQINSVFRRLTQIPDLIVIREKEAKSLAATYHDKMKELTKQGFTELQRDQIIPYPQPEIDSHNQAIINLHLEEKQIEAYLADAPRFNPRLLPPSLLI